MCESLFGISCMLCLVAFVNYNTEKIYIEWYKWRPRSGRTSLGSFVHVFGEWKWILCRHRSSREIGSKIGHRMCVCVCTVQQKHMFPFMANPLVDNVKCIKQFTCSAENHKSHLYGCGREPLGQSSAPLASEIGGTREWKPRHCYCLGCDREQHCFQCY